MYALCSNAEQNIPLNEAFLKPRLLYVSNADSGTLLSGMSIPGK